MFSWEGRKREKLHASREVAGNYITLVTTDQCGHAYKIYLIRSSM